MHPLLEQIRNDLNNTISTHSDMMNSQAKFWRKQTKFFESLKRLKEGLDKFKEYVDKSVLRENDKQQADK